MASRVGGVLLLSLFLQQYLRMPGVSDLFPVRFRVSPQPLLAVFLGRVNCGSFKAGPAPARPPGSAPVRRALAGRLLGSVRSGLWRDGERGRQGRRAATEPAKRIRSPDPPAAGADRRTDGGTPSPGRREGQDSSVL